MKHTQKCKEEKCETKISFGSPEFCSEHNDMNMGLIILNQLNYAIQCIHDNREGYRNVREALKTSMEIVAGFSKPSYSSISNYCPECDTDLSK